jgi:hypothetical protein
MSVEERLRKDAVRIGQLAAEVDKDELLRRIAAGLSPVDDDRVKDAVYGHRMAGSPADMLDESSCLSPDDARMPPLAEIRYHLGHALRNASCARRAAELFELLGYDQAAVTCWQYAADSGDRDAQDYVSEFIDPPPTEPNTNSRDRFLELAHSFR